MVMVTVALEDLLARLSCRPKQYIIVETKEKGNMDGVVNERPPRKDSQPQSDGCTDLDPGDGNSANHPRTHRDGEQTPHELIAMVESMRVALESKCAQVESGLEQIENDISLRESKLTRVQLLAGDAQRVLSTTQEDTAHVPKSMPQEPVQRYTVAQTIVPVPTKQEDIYHVPKSMPQEPVQHCTVAQTVLPVPIAQEESYHESKSCPQELVQHCTVAQTIVPVPMTQEETDHLSQSVAQEQDQQRGHWNGNKSENESVDEHSNSELDPSELEYYSWFGTLTQAERDEIEIEVEDDYASDNAEAEERSSNKDEN